MVKEERTRLNSRLEWQGAEFLVLAHLLIEGVEAYKPYVNHPDYDLVALNAANGKLARISVKSRWATNRAGFFTLDSVDCDFVVHVALNRGHRQQGETIDAEVGAARLYIIPAPICAKVRSASNKINVRNIDNWEAYESNWSPIKSFLQQSLPGVPILFVGRSS